MKLNAINSLYPQLRLSEKRNNDSSLLTPKMPNPQLSFKALATKVCGFCNPQDVGKVLDAARYQKHPNLILGFLISLQHFAMQGLSLTDKNAGELLRLVREGSYQGNVPVKIACVNHFKKADELLVHIKEIYEHAFDGVNGLKSHIQRLPRFMDLSQLLKGFDLVQIHDDMPIGEIERFAQGYISKTQSIIPSPVPKILKAVHVPKNGETYDFDSLKQYALRFAQAEAVNGLILDSSNLAADQIGGTGLVNNWQIARRLVDFIHKKTGKPVGLAGGICPGNVAEAIKIVRPDFIDGNTGFRHDRPDGNGWKTLYPGICPPKDSIAVLEVLKTTSALPGSSYFDNHILMP